MSRFYPYHLTFSALLWAMTPAFAQTPPTSASQPSAEEQTILQLERELVDAYTTGDSKTYDRLMADDIATIIFPSNRVRTKQRVLVASPAVPSDKCEILDMTARVWGNTAIATGVLMYTNKTQTQRPIKYSRRTNTYLKREKGWQLIASHNSPALWWQVRPPEDKQLVALKPLPCTQEASLRSSPEEDVRTYMKTTNLTDKPIISQWINVEGERDKVNQVTIEPGQSRDVYSYLNNTFIVTDTTGKCIHLFQPIREPALVVLK